MRAWVALGGAGLGLALIGYALFAGKTDAERIIEQLDALEAAIAVTEKSTNPVMRSAQVNGAFKEIFTKDVTYSIPDLSSGDRGRAGLAQLAIGAGRYFQTLDVDFGSVELDLVEGAIDTEVRAEATATGRRNSGDFERDTRRVVFGFTKDDDWRIASVRVFAQTE